MAASPVLVPMDGFQWVVRHFDGTRTLSEIQREVQMLCGQMLSSEALQALVRDLDRALILDGPAFSAFLDAYRGETDRPAAHAGRSYPADPAELRLWLDRQFDDPRGAGRPGTASSTSNRPLRGVITPHIDFLRGGPTYTHGFRALVERSDADVFVILGVAHQYAARRFVLTRKHFQTPLGTVQTDQDFVSTLAQKAGHDFFDDELAHRTEHSIEFQAVFLQHLLGGKRPFSIVPILAGSFHDLMPTGLDPIADPEVARFIGGLRETEANCGKKVAYIGGIDLCHVGPEFGDPDRLSDDFLDEVRRFDSAMLARASAVDPTGWFSTAAEVENRWRVCGLAATYTMLHVLGPSSGTLLRYDQAVNPERTCGVSFASLAFEPASDPSAHA